MKKFSRAELHDMVAALVVENTALRAKGRRKPSAIRGILHERIYKNPTEREADRSWRGLQDRTVPLLETLLAHDTRWPSPVSERDYEVAATVMQWLGTAVGQSFLEGLLSTEAWRPYAVEWAKRVTVSR
jgi:hypothetical protein